MGEPAGPRHFNDLSVLPPQAGNRLLFLTIRRLRGLKVTVGESKSDFTAENAEVAEYKPKIEKMRTMIENKCCFISSPLRTSSLPPSFPSA
jgi:hypothetical protein